MSEYFVTMGLQYRHEGHPMIPMEYADPDGYLIVRAESESQAREITQAVLGSHYAFLYPADDFQPHWHPKGCLGEIKHGVFPVEEASSSS